MDRRVGERIRIDVPVTLFAASRDPITGRIEDISFTGAGVRCDTPIDLEPYTWVELWLMVASSDSPERLDAQGFVVRRQEGKTGVMFTQDMVSLVRRLRGLTTQ